VSSIKTHIEPKAYSADDAASALEIADIADAFGGGDDKREGALRVLRHYGGAAPTYELLKRAVHVCSEAERVFQLQSVCEGKGGVAGDAQLRAMGALLTESHASCRDDYECSSPGLDAMVDLALKSGAFGSRLTGAGWGGCTVSLVAEAALPAFLDAMVKGYYAPRGREADVPTALFASAPGSGAAIYVPAHDDL
jgi:galactokinase